MSRSAALLGFPLLLTLLLIGCAKRGPFAETLLERRDLLVVLHKAPSGRYDHPGRIAQAWLAELLSSLRFARGHRSHPLFPESMAGELARLAAKGLKEAERDQLVSFVWAMPAPSFQERITSGGLFLLDGELHLVLANAAVPVAIWQDRPAKRPLYLRPLEPIEPQGGRLFLEGGFKWREVPPEASGFRSPYYGDAPWHIAVRIGEESVAAGKEERSRWTPSSGR